MDEHIETVIVGGGQAGLSTGYFLAQQGREYAVFEAAERIGDQWRRHYESLKLYSPRRYNGLPGLAFPGEPWTFPARDEVADYLEAYALTHGLRVRTHTPVRRVSRSGDGFAVELDGGRITCDNVVAATGLASCTRASTGGPTSCLRAACSWWERPTRAPTSRTSWRRATTSRCAVAISGSFHSVRRSGRRASCCRSWSSRGGTSSPVGRR